MAFLEVHGITSSTCGRTNGTLHTFRFNLRQITAEKEVQSTQSKVLVSFFVSPLSFCMVCAIRHLAWTLQDYHHERKFWTSLIFIIYIYIYIQSQARFNFIPHRKIVNQWLFMSVSGCTRTRLANALVTVHQVWQVGQWIPGWFSATRWFQLPHPPDQLKKCEQTHFEKLLRVWNSTSHTTKNATCCLHTHKLQPKHHCQNGWFSLLEPIVT